MKNYFKYVNSRLVDGELEVFTREIVKGGTSMSIVIDPYKCIGCTKCTQVCPEYFNRDAKS